MLVNLASLDRGSTERIFDLSNKAVKFCQFRRLRPSQLPASPQE